LMGSCTLGPQDDSGHGYVLPDGKSVLATAWSEGISSDNSLLVCRLKCFGDLFRSLENLVDGYPSALQLLRECFPFHQLHDDAAARTRFLKSVNLCDVGMIQGGEQLTFTLKP